MDVCAAAGRQTAERRGFDSGAAKADQGAALRQQSCILHKQVHKTVRLNMLDVLLSSDSQYRNVRRGALRSSIHMQMLAAAANASSGERCLHWALHWVLTTIIFVSTQKKNNCT